MKLREEGVSKKLTCLSLDVQTKFASDERVVDTIEKTLSICREIIPSLSSYDVSVQHEANGYRSLFTRYFSLLEYSLTSCDNNHIESLLPLLRFYSSSFSRCAKWIEADQKDGTRQHFTISLKELISTVQTYYEHADQSDLLFSRVGRNFDLSPTGIRLANLFHTILAFTQIDSPWNKLKALFDKQYRRKFLHRYYSRPTFDEVVNFIALSDSIFMTHIHPYLAFSSYPYSLQQKLLPYHRPYVIFHDQDEKQLRLQRNTSKEEIERDRVKCFIYRSTEQSKESDAHYEETVLIYMHGGGFVVEATEITKNYLPSLTTKLPGLTVIAVHYDAAPAAKFPRATQQLLDAILFFTSGTSQVEDVLGFKPKQYLLGGDSSGAVNSLAALAALNEIKNMQDTTTISVVNGDESAANISFPVAYLGVYPLFYIGPMISPSILAGYKDVVLFPHFMLHMGTCQLDELKSGASIPKINQSDPWFSKSDDDSVIQTFKEYEYIFSSPFFSPFCYDKWHQVAPHVDLIIFTLHDCPLLDFALSMVPIWEKNGGSVHLEVVEKLKHGCFYFMAIAKLFYRPLFNSIDEAENLIVKRVKHVLLSKSPSI